MNPEKRSAHIYAYFLSRFDKQALQSLDFRTDLQAFQVGADRLGVVPNYIKFRRDEFDVEHPHRKGWHKRKMSPSITSVINTFRELDFEAMVGIVREMLYPLSYSESAQELQTVLSAVDDNAAEAFKAEYVSRTITGRKAETAFINWFSGNTAYFGSHSEIRDRRDDGCGYDFLVNTGTGKTVAIEVKALTHDNSGILFTPKEWETARLMGENYILALVSDMDSVPMVEFVNDPYALLSAKRYIQKIVQINWTVSGKEIRKHRTKL
jgi:hypothetical protein